MKEQFSLFLYTSEFWEQYMLQPGGWSAYCGNFLAQFYINQWVGALIQTLLCAVLLILSKNILAKTGARRNLSLAVLLPAMLLFTLQCNYNFTHGNTLTLLCPFALSLLYMNMKRVVLRRLVFTLAIAPVYLFSGAVATCCLYAVCVVFEWFDAKDRWKYATTAWMVVTVLLPYFWQSIYLTSNDKLFQIVDYALDKSISFVLVAWLPFCILIPLQRLSGKFSAMIIIALLLFCGFFLFPKTYRHTEELKFRMYLAVSQNDWDRALKTGKRIKIPDQNAACLINLSLAMKGELPDKMFNYPQTDEYGLLPVHERDSFNTLYGSAFCYHIGAVNEAIRWIFDSNIMRKRGMDYHTLTRLAVWNKENGYEQVAAKYFNVLNHTLMYRSFAKREREADLKSRVATVEQKDFFIGGRDPLSDLARHYENNYKNEMILDYLLCGLLLKNELERFRRLFDMWYFPSKELPKAYQEAFLEMANFGMINNIRRYPIDPKNEVRYRSFIEMVTKGNEEEQEKQFGDTWWNYSYRKLREGTSFFDKTKK